MSRSPVVRRSTTAPEETSIQPERVRRLWILIPAAIAVFYPKVITFSGYLFHFDLIGFAVPVRKFFFDNVRHGRLPLWCPDYAGGFPLFLEGQLGPLYPPNYLFFPWMDPGAAINASVILHALVAGMGMWVWLRRRFSDESAVIGALSYMFSSYLVFRVVHLMLFQSACWLPWLFLFLDRSLEKARPRDGVAMGVVLGLMMTTGQQQGALIAFIAAAVYALVRCLPIVDRRPAVSLRRTGVVWALAGLIALGIASVVIAGVWDLLRESVRQDALPADFVLAQSLRPELWIRLLSPEHHGRMADATWWLSGFNEKEIAVYLGLPAFILAPLGLWRKRDAAAVAHAAVVVVCLLLMLGDAGPFSGVFVELPILNRLRIPTRYLLGAALSLAYLSAVGWEAAREAAGRRRSVILIPLIGLAIWSGTVWSAAYHTYSGTLLTGMSLEHPAAWGQAGAHLFHDLLFRQSIGAALVLGVAIRASVPASSRRASWAVLLAAACVFTDLALHGVRENPVGPSSFYNLPEAAEYLKTRAEGARVYSAGDHRLYGAGGWAQSLEPFRDAVADLPHATPLLFGLSGTTPSTSLIFARTDRVMKTPTLTWLRRMAVRFVISRKEKPLPLAVRFGEVGVYEVPRPSHRYALIRHVVPVVSDEEAFQSAGNAAVDLDEYAYVENWNGPAFKEGGGRLTVLEEEPDRRTLVVTADRSAFVVVRENYHPDWRVVVDDAKVPTFRADYLHWGFVVPSGTHRVTLKFSPPWFQPLLFVYGLTWVAGLTYFAWPVVVRRRRSGWSVVERSSETP